MCVLLLGFWFLHCHVETHVEIGQAAIMQIGDYEDMKEPPKNFPKCGNFRP